MASLPALRRPRRYLPHRSPASRLARYRTRLTRALPPVGPTPDRWLVAATDHHIPPSAPRWSVMSYPSSAAAVAHLTFGCYRCTGDLHAPIGASGHSCWATAQLEYAPPHTASPATLRGSWAHHTAPGPRERAHTLGCEIFACILPADLAFLLEDLPAPSPERILQAASIDPALASLARLASHRPQSYAELLALAPRWDALSPRARELADGLVDAWEGELAELLEASAGILR